MNEFTLSRNGSTLLDYRNQIEPTAVRGPSGATDPVPAAPASLIATAVSGTEVQLSWTDHALDENAYIVERSVAGHDIWQPLASTLPADTTAYADQSVQPAAGYDYRVRCVGPSGFSGFATTTVPVLSGIDDGIPGSWRLQYFGNGLTIIPGISGPDDDPDGDGSPNRMEYAAGTVPTDSSSVFKIQLFEPLGGGYRIGFPAVSGKVYQVEFSPDPATGIWTVEAEGLTTTGTSIETTVTPDPQEMRGFYRARVGN